MSHWPLISWPSVCLLPASRSGLRMNDIIHWDGTRANNQWEVLPTCYRKSRFSFVWLVWQEAIPRYKCWQFLLQNDRDVFWPQKCQNVQNAQNEKNPIEAANCLSAWVDILASECHVLLLDIHQRVKLQKIWKKTISFFFLLSSVDWKRNVSVSMPAGGWALSSHQRQRALTKMATGSNLGSRVVPAPPSSVPSRNCDRQSWTHVCILFCHVKFQYIHRNIYHSL